MGEAACAKCGQLPKFKCERCFEPYCSSECQVADWQDHKGRCYKFPNLIPIHIIKTAITVSLRADGPRRSHGSTTSLNENRSSSNTAFKIKSRNPIECSETSCLNSAKPKKLLDDEDFALMPKAAAPPIPMRKAISPIDHIDVVPVSTIPQKIPNWRTAFPPSVDFFDAIIQFVEEVQQSKRFVWVTDVKYDKALQNLLAEINRNINQAKPCNPDLIATGALVAAPLDKILYRAEILEVSPEAKRANIRLIDYGNELRVPYNQMFEPIPIMVNLNAYAFRVCVPNDCGPLELESIFTIRVVGEKSTQGYYNVECKAKSIPLHLDVEALTKERSMGVVKCFMDGHNALLCLKSVDDLDLDAVLNSAQTLQYDFENLPPEGTFVAARIGRSWKRARLLCFYEKGLQFLVYAIDEGTMVFSSHIKRIPDAFVVQPLKVFAVSTSSPDYMLCEAMLTTAKKLSLQLLPATSAIAGKNPKTHLTCALFDEKRKIVDVIVASVFTGYMDELGLKLWHDEITEGTSVFVSHVITYKEIYIASNCTKEYATIFQSEYSKCAPFDGNYEIAEGDIVIVSDSAGSKYRGEIISCDNKTYTVRNIDRGTERIMDRKSFLKPTHLLRSLPVRCSLVKLMYLEGIASHVANNKALTALESCMENATEFYVTYAHESKQTIDLLFQTKGRESLCKQLLPKVFEPCEPPVTAASLNVHTQYVPEGATAAPENMPLLPTPPDTPIVSNAPTNVVPNAIVKQDHYTINDLLVIPITCGENTSLYVLDASNVLNLENPYIMAADYENKLFAKMVENLSMVGAYCSGPKSPKGGYAPRKMEICLSVFSDDGEWYRVLCIDRLPNEMFRVMFIDYGNHAEVGKKDIMPITADLMFPAHANIVYIEDITSKKQAQKFAKAAEENPIIHAQVNRLGKSDDAYVAKVHNIEKIIG